MQTNIMWNQYLAIAELNKEKCKVVIADLLAEARTEGGNRTLIPR